MSVENAERLLELIKDDPALRDRLNGAGVAGFEATAADLGCECTLEEFATAIKEAAVKMDLTEGPNAALSSVTINVSVV